MTDCDCNPCTYTLANTESVASWLGNLTTELLGTFTKTIVDGRAVWGAPCNLSSTGLVYKPKLSTEGWVCYILRLFQSIGVFVEGEWDNITDYPQNALVAYSSSVYISLVPIPAGSGTPDTRSDLWLLAVEGVVGPEGPPGPAGPAGGAFTVYTYRTVTSSVSVAESDQLIFVEPATALITLTLPQISTLTTAGKFFTIYTTGAYEVQILPSGIDTVDGSASYSLVIPKSSITLVSKGGTNWYIL